MTATRYLILDASGVHVATHVREDLEDRDGTPKKRVWWERPDGRKGLGDLPTSDLPLYGVERLCDHERASVVVCEGEKDAAALSRIGVLAVGTVTGAGGTPSNEVLRWLLGRDVILWPDNDEPGRRHMERIGEALCALGTVPRTLSWPGAKEQGDGAADFVSRGGSLREAEELIDAATPLTPPDGAKGPGPWNKAVPAPVFIAEVDDEVEWFVERIAAPGSVTGVASPRGLGKSHVLHALAVAVASGNDFLGSRPRHGRVLLLDRDNSRREVKRRLRLWGQGKDIRDLSVLTRDDCPALTDAAAWGAFPFGDYDLVILDSLGAATEGLEDSRGGEFGSALAPLLDLARKGPAVVVAMNVPKDGRHYRGPGVIADRLDVLYEVRDATSFEPDPKTGNWWSPLAEGQGEASWAERAGRRRRRASYRLAFVATKFRIGEEPDPWCLEIDCTAPWSIRDVTADLEAAHETARDSIDREREGGFERAISTLRDLVACKVAAGSSVTKSEAEEHLRAAGLTQKHARATIGNRDGIDWRVGRRDGRSTVLFPCESRSTTRSLDEIVASLAGVPEPPELVALGGRGQRDSQIESPLGDRDFRAIPISSLHEDTQGPTATTESDIVRIR